MKIAFSGAGSGGHFYPLMAVADQINHIAKSEKILNPELIYIGPYVLDKEALLQRHMKFVQASAGKNRKYFSLQNFFDYFKTALGIVQALFKMYKIFPDVLFSKGGYAAFPATVAAKILGIPLVIHESDARPGKANVIAAKWAKIIAISYPEVLQHFPEKIDRKKFVLTGNPVRPELFRPIREGAHEFLELDPSLPTILVLGGSSGAKAVNDVLLDALPKLLEKYQIIHQTGSEHLDSVNAIASVKLKNSPHKNRYKTFGYLSTLALRMSFGISSLVVSRAGSGAIFEIAAVGLPSIVIPIPEDIAHDQSSNAFAYAKSGASVVIKQKNLTDTILLNEIDRIMTNPQLWREMSQAAKAFSKPEASKKIADILIKMAIQHEK